MQACAARDELRRGNNCYIVTSDGLLNLRKNMAPAHHHNHPGHRHPTAPITASILRLSVWQRLAFAAIAIAALWAAALWALH